MAHFHIYDAVYDRCTYHKVEKNDQMTRKPCERIAILTACRTTYEEAVPVLYDNAHFTLVLLAGRPLPPANQFSRHCIGKITDCREVFRRMRRITFIVQPGARPSVRKYVARTARLLEAFDYGRRLRIFCLAYNQSLDFFDYRNAFDSFDKISEAFAPLQVALSPANGMKRPDFMVNVDNDLFERLEAALCMGSAHAAQITP